MVKVVNFMYITYGKPQYKTCIIIIIINKEKLKKK